MLNPGRSVSQHLRLLPSHSFIVSDYKEPTKSWTSEIPEIWNLVTYIQILIYFSTFIQTKASQLKSFRDQYAELNGNRSPAWWRDFSQLVKIEENQTSRYLTVRNRIDIWFPKNLAVQIHTETFVQFESTVDWLGNLPTIQDFDYHLIQHFESHLPRNSAVRGTRVSTLGSGKTIVGSVNRK